MKRIASAIVLFIGGLLVGLSIATLFFVSYFGTFASLILSIWMLEFAIGTIFSVLGWLGLLKQR